MNTGLDKITYDHDLDQDESDFVHTFCWCSPDTALCGRDVADSDVLEFGTQTDCVVCAYMEDLPCTRCGK